MNYSYQQRIFPLQNEKIAVLCRSNLNRSVAAHIYLKKSGYNVSSYGTRPYTILPGLGKQTHLFHFGTPYKTIKTNLPSTPEHIDLYTKIGVYKMLERNARLKSAPEKFQSCKEEFSVIVCLDPQAFIDVMEHFDGRTPVTGKIAFVFLIEVEDKFTEAEKAAVTIGEFLKGLERFGDWKNNVDEAIRNFQKFNRSVTSIPHCIQIY